MKQIMRQSMKQLLKTQQGFTLVELMIVVAIIGILAAIAVPQFMSYRLRSYNAGAKAVAHNLKADEANLNAELGVYGHTEGAIANLAAGGANAGNVADTNAVPGLAVAAGATAQGARLYGQNNAGTRGLAIPISLGTAMAANAFDVNNASDQSSFHVFTRHIKGDTAYAIDNDVENTLYTVSNPNWPNTAGIGATQIAAVLPGNANINGVGGGGAPTANWTVLP